MDACGFKDGVLVDTAPKNFVSGASYIRVPELLSIHLSMAS